MKNIVTIDNAYMNCNLMNKKTSLFNDKNIDTSLDNNKGITIVSLIITIIVILIISSTTISVSYKRFEINKFNKMKNDIELLTDKVSNYYLKTNNIPVVLDSSGNKIQYTFTTLNFDKNSSDNSIYYILDLEAMDGLILNYGEEGFKNINASEDVYIINEQSHVIYYVKGIKLNGEYYHYIKNDKENISVIPPTTPQVKIASGELVTNADGTTYYLGAVCLEFVPGISSSIEIERTTYSINGGEEIDISTLTNNLYKLSDMTAQYSITLKTYGTNGTVSTTNSIIKTQRINVTIKKNLNTVLSTTDNIPLEDEFKNKIVVPAGFKILVDSTTGYTAENIDVTKGIVVEDNSGNQFVWIPVGKIYTDAQKTEINAKTITLGRYENFTKNVEGKYTVRQSANEYENKVKIDNYTEDTAENHNKSSHKNATAKDIGDFCKKTLESGGYYIGRYESRTGTERKSRKDKLTPLTLKANDYVYNYVTQLQASEKCQNMYTNQPFESDLINSYAWDTAIIFIQEFENSTYYKTDGQAINQSLSKTGLSVLKETNTVDKQCNIYDMAGNCREWSTETSTQLRIELYNTFWLLFFKGL